MSAPSDEDQGRESQGTQLRWWHVVGSLIGVVVLLYLSAALVRWIYRDGNPVGIATTTTVAAERCTDPPTAEFSVVSPLGMTLDPNPVRAGQLATVIVAAPPSPARPIMGIGLDWLCWNGSQWSMTHKLITDDRPNGPLTLEHPPPPGVTTTLFSLGVSLPSASGILIPDVLPGTYRLQTGRAVGEATVPFVLVEVAP